MMKKFKLVFLASVLIAPILTTPAALYPRGLSTDHRVKIVTYDPNNVVVVQGRYGYQTQIVFAPNEAVENVSIGDSIAWQAVPVNNNLFIKPMASSRTNMTVLTNTNSYNFQLDSTRPSIQPTYRLQFIYPQGGYDLTGNTNAVGQFNPDQLNWKYSFTGTRAIAPIQAFDNGQFTYFKFKKGGMSHLPAIFMVDKNRQETLINYHMQGDYLVVNGVNEQFTLRDGSQVTSVYNDAVIGDWSSVR
jgi:type IV secretion system protein VirB9